MPAMLDLRRTLAALVAVAMSAALIVFSFIISDSATTQMTAAARASVGNADVVVLPEQGGELSEAAAGAISAASGVAGVRTYSEGTIWIDRMGDSGGTEFTYVLDVPSLSGSTRLVEGRLPRRRERSRSRPRSPSRTSRLAAPWRSRKTRLPPPPPRVRARRASWTPSPRHLTRMV
ncbi:hypothetical protein [Actinomyces sp.]|uniref:hypothetical protein n=1 Tax=Actinomyces sp. TaxID=29317 RepID=UPI0026DCF417|nr:hypothetical protein [Actinomyces sp.]MDO4901050.1 hypothetical protein [Actinomyces sp.]